MTGSPQKQPLVLICGPTGVGKTSFAIDLALRFGGEIVGADSVQVYRYMDIGTAKPTAEQRARVPHHLVDFLDPDRPFDAALYARAAGQVVTELGRRGVLPLVVGGTGLYIKALLHGLFETRPADRSLRERLNAEVQAGGSIRLHERLQRLDPEAAARIHPNDAYRIVRALETHEAAGRPISSLHGEHRFSSERYRTLKIGLAMERERLYRRIDERVDAMLADGLLEEVNGLLARGYDEGLKSLQSLGYRHMIDLLRGRTDPSEAVRLLKRDHRRYAKRQLTWFRADRQVHWLEAGDTAAAGELVERFLRVDRPAIQSVFSRDTQSSRRPT